MGSAVQILPRRAPFQMRKDAATLSIAAYLILNSIPF
jgi:hypothetical protein